MRKVTKNDDNKPSCLDLSDPESKASKELVKAIAHYNDPEKEGKSFTFKVYKLQEVKTALETLFHGKCAYCETLYASVHPVDIEHWRPKGGFIEEDGKLHKPGYYWLAAAWSNLLPSCIDCNRSRNQYTIIEGDRKKKKSGKANLFPIQDQGSRSKNVSISSTFDEATLNRLTEDEEPLLLDPCTSDLDIIHYTDEAVFTTLSQNDSDKQKIQASIDVYGLNRVGLVFCRKELQLLIQDKIKTINSLARILEISDQQNLGISDLVEDLIGHEMNSLANFAHEKKPYSEMARQTIERELPELFESTDPTHSNPWDIV